MPYLSAFLDSVGSNFSHGANFATAGSPIRALNSTLRQSGFSPFSLDVQFVQFYNFHNRSQTVRSRGGVYTTMLPEAGSFSQALYTFDIGQNDLTAAYFANKTVEQVETEVPEIISQFKNAVKVGFSVSNYLLYFCLKEIIKMCFFLVIEYLWTRRKILLDSQHWTYWLFTVCD